MPVISGDTDPGNLNDSLAGTAGNDTIEGLGADDTLSGGLGPDLLVGSVGDDGVVGGGGADTIIGGDGDDSIGYAGDSEPGGTAPIVANLGATAYSTSVGGIGVTVQGGTVRDGFGQVDVVSQVESIGGTALGDTLIGSAGDDFLGGGDGADSLSGGTGFDILAPGAGDDSVRGGLAFDEVYYADATGPNGVNVDLSAKQANGSVLVTDPWGDTDVLYEIERIRGTNYADTLIGDGADNRFRGMAGADSIDGGAGIDRVDYLREGTGSIGVTVNLGGLGAVSIGGVGPNQALDPSGALDTLLGIEQVFGTRNADHVVGSGGDDLLRGNGGNDTLEGGSGNDVVSYVLPVGTGGTLGLRLGLGGRFVVELSAGGAAKSLYVIEMDVDGFVRVTDVGSPNADGSDLVRAEVIRSGIDAGDQGISGTSIDFNVAQRFGAVATPSAVGDSIVGGASNDVLNGGAGDDTLVGGAGDDGLAGGGGNDRLDGTDPLEGVGAIDTAIYQPTGTTAAPAHGVIVNLAATPTANTILADGSSVPSGTAFDTTGGTDTLIDIESLAGTNASDTLIGASANNAFGFDRTYFGLGGDDSIAGGTGTVIGAAAYASDWLDQVHYNADADFGGTAAVIVNLGSAPVTASIASGTFTVAPHQARDGFGNTDSLSGIEGAVATSRDDHLVGSDQNDRFRPLRGHDTVIGGPGFDQVDYLRDVNAGGTQGIWVNLGSLALTMPGITFGPSSARDGFGTVDSLVGIESVRATESNDTLAGSSGADLLLGQGGDDWFFGYAGNDTLDGGAGFVDRADYQFETGSLGVLLNLTATSQTLGGQTIGAGTARDTYGDTDTLIGIDEVTGSAHDDTVAAASGLNQSYRLRAGDDTFINFGSAWVNGEGGNDTIIGQATGSYTTVWFQYNSEVRSGSQGITVDLAAGTAQDSIVASLPGSQGSDVLQNVDEINATTGNDLLIGSPGRVEAFAGWGGDDTILGSSDAADRVNYERDVLYLGATGQAQATSGIAANLTGSAVDSTLVGALPAFTVMDGFGDLDTLQNIYTLVGTRFDDAILGGARPSSPNSVPPGSFVYGRDGDDTFIGSAGSDAFFGEDGHDLFRFAPIVPIAGETHGVFANLGSVARTDTFAGQARTVSGGYGHDQFGGIDLMVGVEEVIGSSLADLFYGADATLTPNPQRPEGIFNVFAGLGGADTFVGGSAVANGITIQSGYDAVSYVWDSVFGATQGVTVDLSDPSEDGTAVDGFGATDVLRNIDGLGGSMFADLLVGNATRSTSFMGYGGADTFVGGSAIDSLYYGDEGVGPQGVLVNLGTTAQTLSNGTVTLAGGTARDGLGFIDQLGDMTSGTVTVLIENVYGTDFNDSLFGSAANNLLWGGGGNDRLIGGDGADTLDGGAGNDWADMGRQGQGVGTIVNLGASTVRFDIGTAAGLIAVDTLRTYDNYGKTDVLAGIENVGGTNSADAMVGSDGANTFDARSGDDTMVGGGNADIFLGGRGNDLVDGRASVNDPDDADLVWFQDDFDAARTVPASADDAPGVVVNLTDVDIATAWSLGNPGAGSWTGPQVTSHSAADLLADGDGTGLDQGRDVLLDIEEVRGTTGADTLVGGDAANDDYEGFAGLAGDDVIVGGTGFDRVFYTTDDDFRALPGHGGVVINLSASAIAATVQVPGTTNPASATLHTVTIEGGHALDGFGDIDTLAGIESAFGTRYGDMIAGGSGDEQINGLSGNDTLAGGGGFDEIRFDNGNPTGAIVVDLLAGTATDGFGGQDSISGFEMVRGTLFNDSIKGGASDERFRALGGSDTIDGGGGSDTVDYSRDNTRGGNAGVQVLLGIGTGIDGFGAQDTLVSIENARGTGRADTLLGNGADNRLEGLAGDDTLGVGGGNDSVDGGEGLDTAEFAFGFEDYTGTLLAGGAIRLEDRTPGRDGIITASNVEVFSFADRTLTAAQLTASLTNNAPTGVALESATTSVLENTNTGAALVLGTLVVTDDGRGTNTLSLGGADAAFFETVGTQLRLKAGTVLDFETKASYAVTVGVDDPSVGTAPDASTTYTLSVGDVNEAPTEVHLSGSVAENQAGVLVGSLEASDADAGEAVAFSVSDSRFEVRNGNELWLKAGQSLDFEQAAGILLPVTATDSGGLSVTQAVTVSVTDVNEAPTSVSLVSATTSLAETASTINAVVLADLSVSDDALGTNVLSVTGADAAFFEIVGGQLRLKAGTALNFETRSSYTVTVNVDDASLGGAPDAVSSYTLTVTDVNEAPTAIATTDTVASLPASTGMGSAVRVADLVVTDDGLGTNAFGLSGADAASFEVVGSSLFLKAGTVLDAAAKPAYAVTVTVDDATTGGSPDATVAFNLAVTGSSAGAIAINNAPVIVSNGGGATGALPVLSGTTAVTTVHATDADAGAALVYSLAGGADQSLFQIDPSTGVLRFVGAPNFATPADAGANNVYDVVVRVSDGALVDEQAIAVTVDPAQGLVPGIGGQAGFGTDALPRNDDSVTSQLAIGSVFENGLNFFGNVFSALFISNNGRVTFNSPDGSFTPQAITGATNNAQIGVFFADVDTRGGSTTASPGGQSTGSNLVYYAFDVPNDRIVITWDDVGYYSNHVDKVNSFQLILTDRSSTGQAGDFDITFRYEAINWTTGDASQGSNGFGGIVARAGYSAGTGVAGTYFELPTSGNQQAMLDLDASAGNTGLAGIWEFQVRNGVVDAPPSLTLGSATATLVEATAYDAGTDTSSIALTILDDNDLGSYVTTGWTQLTATTFRKAGLYGAAVLDTVANTVTYTLDNADPDTDALATGTTAHDLFSLSVTDGFSTVSRDIDFAITGRNETLASGPAPGTTGDDTLSGIGGDFSLAGVAGNDSYIVDSAGDLVIETAGNGSDTVFVRTVASYTMSGNVEVAVLQSGTAAIVDNGADNSIFGNGLDNDVTLNQGGDDTVVAGGGNDTVSASAGSNALFGNEGADSLLGGSGDDRLIGGTGADVALGSGGNDTLWGEDGADSLSGDDGNDVIVGGTGDDTMDGGAGNDSYEVDSLFDLIMPDSEGTDTVHVSYDGFVLDAARGDLEVIVFEAGVVNGSGNDFSNTLFGNAGANTLLAGGGNDTVVAGEGADSASGGDDQDQLFGQGGSDTLDGGNGFDQLIGGTGDDRLVGGAGADTLWGEDGNDSLEGGPGDDHLLGGAGQDHFIISIGDGVDTIYDYNAAQDTIDVLAPAGSWSVVAGGGFYSVLDSGGAVFLQVVGSDPPLLT